MAIDHNKVIGRFFDNGGKVQSIRVVPVRTALLHVDDEWLRRVREDMEDLIAKTIREDCNRTAELRDVTPEIWRQMVVRLTAPTISNEGRKAKHARSRLDHWQPLQVVGARRHTALSEIKRARNPNDKADPRNCIYAAAAIAALANVEAVGTHQALQQGAALTAWFFELQAPEIDHNVRARGWRLGREGQKSPGARRDEVARDLRAKGITNKSKIAREVAADREYQRLRGTPEIESIRRQLYPPRKKSLRKV